MYIASEHHYLSGWARTLVSESVEVKVEICTLDSGIIVVDSNIDGVAGIGNTLGGWDLQALEYIGG